MTIGKTPKKAIWTSTLTHKTSALKITNRDAQH